MPENDVRSSPHEEQHHLQYPRPSDNNYASPLSMGIRADLSQEAHDAERPAHVSKHNDVPELGYGTLLSNHTAHDFSAVHGEYDVLSGSAFDPAFPNIVENIDFAAAFANFQSCNDCTGTDIPHHHHPSGRLAGASATLDGHFCCSWLVHSQPCFLCFESAEALDNHIKNDHAGKDSTYQCLWQNCSKHDSSTKTAGAMNFGNKPKLMRHVHSHTGYKPFPCLHPGCDKGFVTKEQLRNHETTHTKSRKYKCDQCGKAFAVKSALTTHITAVHDEKKIHSCDICGKSFADSSNLSKHKQTHYRDSSVKKRRSTRGTSSVTSTRSSPSASTLSVETVTPVMGVARLQELSGPSVSPSPMAPPTVPKLSAPSVYSSVPITYNAISTISTTSSPPPESFDPNCFCCDQHCPLPEGPATPCDEAEDCDLDGFCCDDRCTPPNGLVAPCTDPEDCDIEGFCDLPNCLAQDGYGTTMSSPQTSISSYHCSEPLMHHQIEQLRNFQMPSQWGDLAESNSQAPQRSLSHRELEEQFTNMHGS